MNEVAVIAPALTMGLKARFSLSRLMELKVSPLGSIPMRWLILSLPWTVSAWA